MGKKMKKRLFNLLACIGLLIWLYGCSVFISTPRIARINIQGLDNKYREYIVPLDAPSPDKNLDIPITKHYAIQLDFDWLWESGNKTQPYYYDSFDEDTAAPLTPWMLCKYRF